MKEKTIVHQSVRDCRPVRGDGDHRRLRVVERLEQQHVRHADGRSRRQQRDDQR